MVNVYIPPHFNQRVLYTVYEKLATRQFSRLYIAGNFNSIMDPSLDLFNSSRVYTPHLIYFNGHKPLSILKFVDGNTRPLGPTPSTHKTVSGIDLVFGNTCALVAVQEVSYLPAGLSDHAPLEVKMVLVEDRRQKCWRWAPKWLQDPKVEKLVSSKSTSVVWEAFKAPTKGDYISAIKVVHSEISSQVQQFEDGHFSQLADARRTLSVHLASAAHFELGSLAGRIFEFGDKNRKLLANLVADSRMQMVVPEICCSDGRVVSDPEHIINEF